MNAGMSHDAILALLAAHKPVMGARFAMRRAALFSFPVRGTARRDATAAQGLHRSRPEPPGNCQSISNLGFVVQG